MYHTQVSISDPYPSTASVFVHNLLEMPFCLFSVPPNTLSSQKRRAETAPSGNRPTFYCIIYDNMLCSLLQRGSRIADAAGKRREYLPKGNLELSSQIFPSTVKFYYCLSVVHQYK